MSAASSGEAHIHGAVVLDQRKAYAEIVGTDVLEAAIDSLPEDRQREYREVLAVGWIRCTTVAAVVEAVARRVGRDPLELDAVVVRKGVERTFGTLWRVLLRLASDAQIVTRAPVLYGKTYDKGSFTAHLLGPGHAECRLVDFPEITELDLQGLGIGVVEALKISGRSDVRHVATRTKDGARIEVRWRI